MRGDLRGGLRLGDGCGGGAGGVLRRGVIYVAGGLFEPRHARIGGDLKDDPVELDESVAEVLSRWVFACAGLRGRRLNRCGLLVLGCVGGGGRPRRGCLLACRSGNSRGRLAAGAPGRDEDRCERRCEHAERSAGDTVNRSKS